MSQHQSFWLRPYTAIVAVVPTVVGGKVDRPVDGVGRPAVKMSDQPVNKISGQSIKMNAAAPLSHRHTIRNRVTGERYELPFSTHEVRAADIVPGMIIARLDCYETDDAIELYKVLRINKTTFGTRKCDQLGNIIHHTMDDMSKRQLAKHRWDVVG